MICRTVECIPCAPGEQVDLRGRPVAQPNRQPSPASTAPSIEMLRRKSTSREALLENVTRDLDWLS
jgi:hypothetical protein